MIPAHGYTFGPFRFDPAEGRLTRDGDAVRVPAKALALLTLLSRAGYLVSPKWRTPSAGSAPPSIVAKKGRSG